MEVRTPLPGRASPSQHEKNKLDKKETKGRQRSGQRDGATTDSPPARQKRAIAKSTPGRVEAAMKKDRDQRKPPSPPSADKGKKLQREYEEQVEIMRESSRRRDDRRRDCTKDNRAGVQTTESSRKTLRPDDYISAEVFTSGEYVVNKQTAPDDEEDDDNYCDHSPRQQGRVERKWLLKDQPLYIQGKYCYGFSPLRERQRVVFVFPTPPPILDKKRKQWKGGLRAEDCDAPEDSLRFCIRTKLLDEQAERERQKNPEPPQYARFTSESKIFSIDDQQNHLSTSSCSEPVYRFKCGAEQIELSFAVSAQEARYHMLFVYQFFLEDTSVATQQDSGIIREVFKAQSVPSMVVDPPTIRQKAMFLLICHVFKRKTEIGPKELKRLFKLLSPRIDYVKRCFRSHPWEEGKIDGSGLPDVLHWFIKCSDTFDACPILFEHSVMFGFLTRTRTEEILMMHEEGTFLLRIGSNVVGGLVMSTRMNGKFIHVTIEPSTDKEVLKQMTVPSLIKAICFDGTPLPKANMVGLFRARGVRL